jgi:hypothetical protein
VQGIRILLRALGEGKAEAPPDIQFRWTWRLAKATRKLQDRRVSADLPDAKRLLGTLANSRGHRHEENAGRLVNVALAQPVHVAVALLASAEGYTPTAQQLVDRARDRLGTIGEVANALADNLPQPKPAQKSRRRRRKKRPAEAPGEPLAAAAAGGGAAPDGAEEADVLPEAGSRAELAPDAPATPELGPDGNGAGPDRPRAPDEPESVGSEAA